MIDHTKIVLVGFMGVGKSLIGDLLAQRLNFLHIDIDQWIEMYYNTSISDIFDNQGESTFRQKEASMFSFVSELSHTVISTGGGLPTNKNQLDLFRRQDLTTIHLKLNSKAMSILYQQRSSRPIIRGLNTRKGFTEFVENLYLQRISYYNKADFSLESHQDINSMIAQIESFLS